MGQSYNYELSARPVCTIRQVAVTDCERQARGSWRQIDGSAGMNARWVEGVAKEAESRNVSPAQRIAGVSQEDYCDGADSVEHGWMRICMFVAQSNQARCVLAPPDCGACTS